MSDESGRDFEGFERRAREAFDASVEALDAATGARLEQARQRALATVARPSRSAAARGGWAWAPVGALAAGVLAAALLLRGPDESTHDPGPVVANPATVAQEPIEMFAAGDEFDIATADEDLEFYEWVEQATSDSGNGNGQS